MRINEILLENRLDDQINEIAVMLKQHCQPFLTEMRGSSDSLYRGVGYGTPLFEVTPRVKIGTTRSYREPLDSYKPDQQVVDAWFKQKFGIAFRSDRVAFCSGNFKSAGSYGDLHRFVPIGNFSFCWSPKIKDLTDAVPRVKDIPLDSSERAPAIIKILEDGDFRVTDLQAAINAQHEIMVKCEKYYLLQVKTYDYIEILTQAMQ